MENLATLIGTKNLQTLIADENNTHVVTKDDTGFKVYENTSYVKFQFVIGIGSKADCESLLKFLSTNVFNMNCPCD